VIAKVTRLIDCINKSETWRKQSFINDLCQVDMSINANDPINTANNYLNKLINDNQQPKIKFHESDYSFRYSSNALFDSKQKKKSILENFEFLKKMFNSNESNFDSQTLRNSIIKLNNCLWIEQFNLSFCPYNNRKTADNKELSSCISIIISTGFLITEILNRVREQTYDKSLYMKFDDQRDLESLFQKISIRFDAYTYSNRQFEIDYDYIGQNFSCPCVFSYSDGKINMNCDCIQKEIGPLYRSLMNNGLCSLRIPIFSV